MVVMVTDKVPGCGGILNSTTDKITSLDLDKDGLYDRNLDCRISTTKLKFPYSLKYFSQFLMIKKNPNTCVKMIVLDDIFGLINSPNV
jgi:hypothetical protein